jgi:hypothetical protein
MRWASTLPSSTPPLVERVNVPDCALCENAVLVEGYQLAESFRCEPIGEDSVRRAVTLEDPVGYEPIRRGSPSLQCSHRKRSHR